MKIGICYMVFDGYELLEYAIKSIRNVIDYVSVTYQDISYFGNKADPELKEKLFDLKSKGLIDECIFYETDLSLTQKQNELNLRNLGLEYSKKNNCTHHISSDVDEFYKENEFLNIKNEIKNLDFDYSMVHQEIYYKKPTYMVYPCQNLMVSFIHPVNNYYFMDNFDFPHHIEITRRFKKFEKPIVFDKNLFCLHHMSYVRKDISKKWQNSDNARFYKIKKFIEQHNKYKVGEIVHLLPDYLNTITIEVENYFNIEDIWEQHQ